MRFERRLKPETRVDLTPLIDVVFQLVIFFMVSSVFKTAPGIPMDLPTSSSPEPVTVTELRIKIINEEQIYLNFTLTDLKGLSNLLKTEALVEEGAPVLIEGDKQVPYQTLVAVLDILRQNNIDGVSLLTDIEQKGTSSP